MAYDRNEVLERTDLRELAHQLAGPRQRARRRRQPGRAPIPAMG